MRDSMRMKRLYNNMNIISPCLKATERESKPFCKLVYSFLIVIICLSFLEITVKSSEITKFFLVLIKIHVIYSSKVQHKKLQNGIKSLH